MRKTIRLVSMLVITSMLILSSTQIRAASEENRSDHDLVIDKVRALLPESIQMTDRSIDVLSEGLYGLNPNERTLFEKYFNPGDSGDIDEDYIANVLENYRKIRTRLSSNISLVYEEESNRCELMTLYFTDFVRIHICPYAAQETNQQRMARGIVHEAAHMAFLAFDRSYYYPNYSVYEGLKPEPHQATRIPLIGYIIREVLRDDTLYNADTYAKFAAELYSIGAGADIEAESTAAEVLGEEIFSPEVKYSGSVR